MSKKILMVYPKNPPTFWNFDYLVQFMEFKTVFPPLGLMTIAAMLPSDYDIKLVDLNVTDLDESDVLWADYVMLSAMIVQKTSFAETAALCKRLGKTVIAGGPYVTALHEEIKHVDHFVMGEAEMVFPEFLADLESGNLKPTYEHTGDKPDLTMTPPPRFDLVKWSDYYIVPLQFSRGCPFNCEFCDIIEMLGHVPRSKPPEQFIRELDLLYDSGFLGQVFIVDDNFIGNRKKTKELLRHIIVWQRKHEYPYQLLTEASIDMGNDDELLDLMEEAGFRFVFIGIETPDSDTLQSINKMHNVRANVLGNIRKIQRRNMEVMGGFIVGFDTDPENIIDLQMEFIQKAGIPGAMAGILTVFPNTQLYRRLEKEGRLKYTFNGDNMSPELNFVSRIPEDKLLHDYKNLIQRLYSPKNYLKRCETLIKKMPRRYMLFNMLFKTWRYKQFLGCRKAYKSQVRTYLSCYFKIVFTTSYGFQTLRLWRFMFTRPFQLDLALMLALKGYHYIRLAQDIADHDNPDRVKVKAQEVVPN